MGILESSFRVAPEVVFSDLGGEAVMLNLTSGRYYGLDATGTRVWRLLSDGHAVRAVVGILAAEYAVDPLKLQADLLAFVGELERHGLVRSHDPGLR